MLPIVVGTNTLLVVFPSLGQNTWSPQFKEEKFILVYCFLLLFLVVSCFLFCFVFLGFNPWLVGSQREMAEQKACRGEIISWQSGTWEKRGRQEGGAGWRIHAFCLFPIWPATHQALSPKGAFSYWTINRWIHQSIVLPWSSLFPNTSLGAGILDLNTITYTIIAIYLKFKTSWCHVFYLAVLGVGATWGNTLLLALDLSLIY